MRCRASEVTLQRRSCYRQDCALMLGRMIIRPNRRLTVPPAKVVNPTLCIFRTLFSNRGSFPVVAPRLITGSPLSLPVVMSLAAFFKLVETVSKVARTVGTPRKPYNRQNVQALSTLLKNSHEPLWPEGPECACFLMWHSTGCWKCVTLSGWLNPIARRDPRSGCRQGITMPGWLNPIARRDPRYGCCQGLTLSVWLNPIVRRDPRYG